MVNHGDLESGKLIFRSPAKINLFLRILKKREDNFHELSTLIQAIDYFDYLHFSKSSCDSFTTSNPNIPTDERNLVLKALKLFRKTTGWHQPLAIHLDKYIPFEAGLGGGSGNAATTLFACNCLSNLNLSNETLSSLSSEIGSDIPFFFSKGSALCEGRGEIVTSVDLPKRKYSLFKPKEGLSTPAVFKNFDLTKKSTLSVTDLLLQFKNGQTPYINDLELPALNLLPSLLSLKEEISRLGQTPPLMTGSGSVFFAPYNQVFSNHPLFIGHFNSIERSQSTWW